MSSSSAPLRRLDVTTWTLHDEVPSQVDAAADRRARGYLLVSEIIGWSYLPFLLVCVIPSFNGVATLPPLVLIAVTVGALPVALAAVYRYRALRRYTGAPVISELNEPLGAAAEVLSQQWQVFHELATATDIDPAEQRKVTKLANGGFKELGKMHQHVLRHCDLAALGEAHGWRWLRDRQVRQTVKLCSVLAAGGPAESPSSD